MDIELSTRTAMSQTIQHDADFLLRGILLAGYPADVLDKPLRRRFSGSGFLSHLHSLAVTMSQKSSVRLPFFCEISSDDQDYVAQAMVAFFRESTTSRLLKNTRIGLFSWPSCVSRPPRQRCARGHAVPTRGPATPAAGDQGHLASRFRNRTT